MKARRTLYYILATIFLLFNIISWANFDKSKLPKDAAERAGYYFGSCMFLIIGLIFLFLALSVSKKIKRKKELQLMTHCLVKNDI